MAQGKSQDSLIASNTAGLEVNKIQRCDIITKIWV
jgi:hypothetical protein